MQQMMRRPARVMTWAEVTSPEEEVAAQGQGEAQMEARRQEAAEQQDMQGTIKALELLWCAGLDAAIREAASVCPAYCFSLPLPPRLCLLVSCVYPFSGLVSSLFSPPFLRLLLNFR